MLLTINHTTNYEYNDNLLGLIQTTKLTPSPYNGLKIIEWSVKRNNKEGGVVFRDGEGNNIVNFKSEALEKTVKFEVRTSRTLESAQRSGPPRGAQKRPRTPWSVLKHPGLPRSTQERPKKLPGSFSNI